MSKHTDKYPEFDGTGDWKTWTGKIRPKLFKKKSQAYPDKTLFHLTKLEQTPRERGPLVKHVLKVEYEPSAASRCSWPCESSSRSKAA